MNNKLLPIIAAVVVAAAAVIAVIPKNKSVSTTETAKVSVTETAKVSVTEAAKPAPTEKPEKTELNVEFSSESGIEIAADTLPENKAAVISFNVDGTDMALLAVKDSSGEIHTSFDTCQVCNGSPRAYFEEKNGVLQCQNCGNKFTLDAVGSESYGCNPIKVDDAAVSVTDTGITVSGEYLIANADLFSNWKK